MAAGRTMAARRRVRDLSRLPGDRDSEEGRCLRGRFPLPRRRQPLVVVDRFGPSGRPLLTARSVVDGGLAARLAGIAAQAGVLLAIEYARAKERIAVGEAAMVLAGKFLAHE